MIFTIDEFDEEEFDEAIKRYDDYKKKYPSINFSIKKGWIEGNYDQPGYSVFWIQISNEDFKKLEEIEQGVSITKFSEKEIKPFLQEFEQNPVSVGFDCHSDREYYCKGKYYKKEFDREDDCNNI